MGHVEVTSRSAACCLGGPTLVGVALGAFLLGCGGGSRPRLPGDLLFESDHFRYHARASSPVCAGIARDLEEHAAGVLAMIGAAWPDGRVIDYYRYDDAADFAANAPCGGDALGGCYDPDSDKVHAVSAFHNHELIHAYLHPIGNPPPIYREGIAETIDCMSGRSLAPEEPFRSIRWEDLAALPEVPDGAPALEYYEAARRFVRSSIDRFGLPAFVDFYAGARAVDPPGFRAEFEAFFGASLEGTWRAAMQAAFPAGNAICPCQGEATPADGLPHTGGSSGGCGYIPRVIELPVSGPVTIDVNEGSPMIMSCTGRLPTPAIDLGNSAGGTPRLLATHLEAGRYFVLFVGPSTRIGATVGPASAPWIGNRGCQALIPLELPALDARPLLVAFPQETWMAGFLTPRPYPGTARILGRGGQDDRAFVCGDCTSFEASAASCARLSSDGAGAPVQLDGTFVVGFAPPQASDLYVSIEISP